MIGFLTATLKNYSLSYTGLPKKCWQGITLTFFNAMSVGICFFLSLYFVNNMHFSVALAGVLISFYGLGTVIGGIIAGKLSDRISPIFVSTLSLFMQSMAFLLLTKLKSVELVAADLFVLGIAAYGFKTSNNVWMLNQCEDQSELRLKTVNISHAASNFGLGLSGVVIGIFANDRFENIFLFSGALLFLSAIYLLWQMSIQSPEMSTSNEVFISKSVSEKRDRKIILLILICLFLIGLIIAQLSATYPIYVQEKFSQLGIKAVSILFILDTVLIVLFQAPLVNLLSARNKIAIVGLGALLMGTGMLILNFSFHFALAIFSCIVWTTGEMLFIPMAQLVCYEKGVEKKKGQALGIFQATFAMSSIMGPILGSFVYQYLGGNVVWYISAAIGFLCFIACQYYKNDD